MLPHEKPFVSIWQEARPSSKQRSGRNRTQRPRKLSAAPGDTAILRTGALTLNSGSNFTLDLVNTTAGTGYDQVGITGTVTLGGSNLIARAGAGLNLGDKFFVLLNDGSDAISGTFVQGTTVTSGIYTFLINYGDNGDGGGTANDISLTVMGVPEPGNFIAGVFALGIIASALLKTGRRRRRVIDSALHQTKNAARIG